MGSCPPEARPFAKTVMREQAEQNGAGASNGQVGPLPLGFEADMGADLLEGHFDLPALDKPSQNLIGGLL